MSNPNEIERSIHYASNEYSGKFISFDELTPIFIGYRKDKTISSTDKTSKRFCYVLHIISKGDCVFIESGERKEAHAGDVFIAKPHVPIAYEFDEKQPVDMAWIGFYGNYAKKLDDVSSLHHVSFDYYSKIERLLNLEGQVYAEPVAEILFNVMSDIFATGTSNSLAQIKKYLDENYMNHISIEELAKSYSYNRTYLSHLFKKQYGFSLKEYLSNKRLNEALKLILDGESISDVAYLVGFGNPYNFSNAFKEKFGVSPNKYKKK